MKKCPYCENPVGETSILCPVCKNILTEPERTKKQKLKNFFYGAAIVIIVLGISAAIYFMLGTTPVSSFVKGNAALFSDIANTDTLLLKRLTNDTFRADFHFTLRNVHYIPSAKAGDLNLNFRFRKTKTDAAFETAYDVSGIELENLLLYTAGKRMYLGRPYEGTPAYYMEYFSSENMPFADKLPILLTQFKTKEAFYRFTNSALSLFTESIKTEYIKTGEGKLVSCITGKPFSTDTITLGLDRERLRNTWAILYEKLKKTPSVLQGFEDLLKNFLGGRSFRDFMEKDLERLFGDLPENALLNWTVHKTGDTPIAVDVQFTGSTGTYRLLVQNEKATGVERVQFILDIPDSGQNGKLHTAFDIGIHTEGDYTNGKSYDIGMKAAFQTGNCSIAADVRINAVLQQISAFEYKTTGKARLALEKDGATKTFDIDCSLSYNFDELTTLKDSAEIPIDAIAAKAQKTSPEAFIRHLLDAYGSPFLLDDFKEAP